MAASAASPCGSRMSSGTFRNPDLTWRSPTSPRTMRATAMFERTMSMSTRNTQLYRRLRAPHTRLQRPHRAEAHDHDEREHRAEDDLPGRERAVQQQPHRDEPADEQDGQPSHGTGCLASRQHRADIRLRLVQRARGGIQIRHGRARRDRQRDAQQDQKRHRPGFDDSQARRRTPGHAPEEPHADAAQRDEAGEPARKQRSDQEPRACGVRRPPAATSKAADSRANFAMKPGKRRQPGDEQRAAHEREPQERHRRRDRHAHLVVRRVQVWRLSDAERRVR